MCSYKLLLILCWYGWKNVFTKSMTIYNVPKAILFCFSNGSTSGISALNGTAICLSVYSNLQDPTGFCRGQNAGSYQGIMVTIMFAFFRYFIGGSHLCHVLGIKYCLGFDIVVGMGLVSGLLLSLLYFNSSSTYGPTCRFFHTNMLFLLKNIYFTSLLDGAGLNCLSCISAVVAAYRLSCPEACGVLVPRHGSNPHPLHSKADSQPLNLQGGPIRMLFLIKHFGTKEMSTR